MNLLLLLLLLLALELEFLGLLAHHDLASSVLVEALLSADRRLLCKMYKKNANCHFRDQGHASERNDAVDKNTRRKVIRDRFCQGR